MSAERPVVAMLLYPGFTHLDLIGPHAVWSPWMDVHLVWRTLDPVASDSGLRVVPTTTFEDCPRDVDVLFVPGGTGTGDVLLDAGALALTAELGASARYVTSVCTGSLVLGGAGLLDGHRAGTHWAFRELLAPLGAQVVPERVVVDRNRITGGGVTAGIDFGLTVLAELLGEPRARFTQLGLEYDPAPPFDCGSPEKAGPELVEQVREVFVGDNRKMEDAVTALAAARSGAPA
ncbi:DJ-1/PfpI family protein [Actinosynnema pretiosum subsp. pretiosum]|uniref:ThiJ/PfpI domain protein n=2 Tax=Actinosynnema TaxID=40566 RepID=C6WIS8_ACTMD|nr:DJ-1/PfpI family protein [Actinosynnema mirum]ACU38168.1 ThiJ/PfpI domain protein [Actinosynnema mirum DSM 43827]AXX31670.1 ThiJ/PfpI family protein [Actinosynnema pretiosum subsp. pretiosum]QUF04313.1 DJ-1/PfpI family protein [Actinosynnema pretiosum subsp. pretiosum]